PTIDEEIYSLNIKAFIGQRSDIMISQWNKIVPTIRFWIGQRRTPTSIALSDGKRLLVQGGNNPGTFKYLNQTAIYDASTNTWAKGGPYTVDNVGVKQIYSATAVNLPNGLVGFYGGFEQYANTSVPEISGNGNAVTFDGRNLSYVGFNCFITHNTDSGTWSPFSPQSSTLLDFYPTSQTATINPNTGKVYYLGGSYYTTTSNWAPIKIPFSWAAVFDTKSGSWSNETMGGNLPTARMYHTANLLPNSQDIILYGGSEDDKTASTSFCYTLNLETNTWTKHDTVNVPAYLSGPRFSHSAVLVDTTLFILFGRGVDGALNPSLLTIDVANATNIIYTANYAANTTTNSNEPNSNKSNSTESNSNETNSNETNSSGSGSNESSKLSAGAIGGISAGSVVAGLGIIAFIFFYLRRQKKAKQQDTHEDMDVDWDKIEEHYKEVPVAKSNSPQLTESPEIIENISVRHHSPILTENTTVNSTPDVVVTIVKPSVASVDNYMSVKPEGE
ncbi:hypothetical protein INT48_003133, partial [Thamnidium elegans]